MYVCVCVGEWVGGKGWGRVWEGVAGFGFGVKIYLPHTHIFQIREHARANQQVYSSLFNEQSLPNVFVSLLELFGNKQNQQR